MELLRHYSNTPDLLHDLRRTLQILAEPCEEPSAEESLTAEATARPWSVSDRLSAEDIATLIKRYHDGTTGPELAKEYNISLSSVKRLLQKHNARLRDRLEP